VVGAPVPKISEATGKNLSSSVPSPAKGTPKSVAETVDGAISVPFFAFFPSLGFSLEGNPRGKRSPSALTTSTRSNRGSVPAIATTASRPRSPTAQSFERKTSCEVSGGSRGHTHNAPALQPQLILSWERWELCTLKPSKGFCNDCAHC